MRGHYVVGASDNAVHDAGTGLTWQQTAPAALYTWDEAKAYCRSLGAGWRLPTVKELESLIDDLRSDPAMDPAAFPSALSGNFWSLTVYMGAPASPWLIDFSDGWTAITDSSTNNVRCVL